MPDPLPVPRSEISRFIKRHGVTRCPPATYRPHPTAAEAEDMRRKLAEMERLGELIQNGVGKGQDWRDLANIQWNQRANKLRRLRTQERYQLLIEAGLNDEQIAAQLNVYPRTARAAAKRMGLTVPRATPPHNGKSNLGRPPDQKRREKVKRLVAEGKTSIEIAAACGVGASTIRKLLCRMGIRRRPGPPGPRINKGELVRLFREGWSKAALSRHFKVNSSSISKALKRMGEIS